MIGEVEQVYAFLMSAADGDFTEILKDAPQGEWIALASDESRIVATSPEFSIALAAARNLGEEDPVMMKLPPPYSLVLRV